MTAQQEHDQELFINRELSWLEFNGRVLQEAADPSNRLLERLKFATIVASNLDEFFIVRVARLRHALREGDTRPDPAGLTPRQQLDRISVRAHEMLERLYVAVMDQILPSLADRGVRILGLDQLRPSQRASASRYFRNEVLPALTPLASDASRPFPMLSGLSLNLAVLLAPEADGEPPRLAVVQVPAGLPRLVPVQAAEGTTYLLLEELIRSELSALFPGQPVVSSAAIRISRDSELDLDDEGGRDFIDVVEEELRKRRRSRVARLEVEAGVGRTLLGVDRSDVYMVKGPLDLRALRPLLGLPTLEDLKDPPHEPVAVLSPQEEEDLFAVLEERDLLLHHPYESFDPVVSLVSQAAEDPSVLAIKQTLYRTSGDSPIVAALMRAASQDKQVTVVIELTARFDEESNIRWARSLEEAGAHVIYGVRGYKTHAKACLVVRRGRRGIQRFVHLGTGNYNSTTARLYTDFGLLTSNPQIGEDVSTFFNALTGYSDPPRLKALAMAPTQLRDRFLKLIERERRWAEDGQPGEIDAKINSLTDEEIIRALCRASQSGVRIRLNVRGICRLRPGLKGRSENIEVISVVDRFLEHSRVFHFRNGGDEEVYLSSADWMARNLDWRIELLFPVQREDCRRKVLNVLSSMFRDNVKARRLGPDQRYRRRRPARGEEPHRAQVHLAEEARRTAELARTASGIKLEPLVSPGR